MMNMVTWYIIMTRKRGLMDMVMVITIMGLTGMIHISTIIIITISTSIKLKLLLVVSHVFKDKKSCLLKQRNSTKFKSTKTAGMQK